MSILDEVRNRLTEQECLVLMEEAIAIVLNHKSYIGSACPDKIIIAYPALSLCSHVANLCVEYGNLLVANKLKVLEDIIVNNKEMEVDRSMSFYTPSKLLEDIKNHIVDSKNKWLEDESRFYPSEQISDFLSIFESLHDWIIAKLELAIKAGR